MSRCTIYITPEAWSEVKHLPGHMRQRVKRAIDALASEPRPSGSKALELPACEHQVRRLRLNMWRIVYMVAESELTVDVVAVRKRPPYDYGDLAALLRDL
jgi:mRNA interferase RelE/StbE